MFTPLKYFFSTTFLTFLFPVLLFGQIYLPAEQERFTEGLNHYRNLNLERAAEAFRDAPNMPEAQLMLGNTLFKLNQMDEAARILQGVRTAQLGELSEEAAFSLALIRLSQRNIAAGLELLTGLNSTFDPQLSGQARETALQWAAFLTLNQRLQVLDETSDTATRLLLLETGIDVHHREEARQLILRSIQLGINREDTNALRSRLDNRIARSAPGRNMSNGLEVFEVPEGFVYRVGVVLPQQNRSDDAFEVSRAMFNGLLLAVSEFNRSQTGTRIELRLFPTSSLSGGGSAGESRLEQFHRNITRQLQEWQPDVIFGPLYSEEAAVLARVGESLEIPVLAPLANAEDLTRGNPWIFQLNPTFRERGRMMAEIAVQYLGHRRISILVDANSIGLIEAEAFRQRALELGAEIPYFIREDFQAQRFDMSPHSRFFAGDPRLLNMEEDELRRFLMFWTPSDALFMPVTGSAGRTIFDLMMTQLMALRSNVQVIGSQEIGGMNLNQAAARRFRVVYSEVFDKDPNDARADVFTQDFRNAYGSNPDMFATIGYDSGVFITRIFERSGNPEQFQAALRTHDGYRGIGKRFDFRSSQINNALIPLQFGQNGFERINLAPEPIFDPSELTEASSRISEVLSLLSESMEGDDILQAYYQFINQGMQPESALLDELFTLLQRFDPDEIPFMVRGYRIEDFE